MNAKRIFILALLTFMLICAALAQGKDPSEVKPAWEMEKEAAATQANARPSFGVSHFGYVYPILSGSLAGDLAEWASPVNLSAGFESTTSPYSDFLSGVELELYLTFNDKGVRFQMNDLVMFGYSFGLDPLRINLGARLGLSMLDVTDDTSSSNTYTGFGVVAGPEASLYVSVGSDTWVWVRGRYTTSAYLSIDSGTNPINSGRTTLNILSLQAGLAFSLK